ncbi:unnamed protein product [Arctogadus glacialis]|nr:glycoprotein hormones alpha chain [Gadus chalcogrammus]XP_059908537.1 glycoprotein hormones alpha chain isoform X2 [Gadus macrocephalus]
MTASMKSATLSALLLCFLLYIADSYQNTDMSRMGCGECTLRRNPLFSRERPVYQCMGCCFSKAFPTPLKSKEAMIVTKNITSEATCCVASRSTPTKVTLGNGNTELVKNQTACHCSTCRYHRQ